MPQSVLVAAEEAAAASEIEVASQARPQWCTREAVGPRTQRPLQAAVPLPTLIRSERRLACFAGLEAVVVRARA